MNFFKKTIVFIIIIFLIFGSFNKEGFFINKAYAAKEFSEVIGQAAGAAAGCMATKIAIRKIQEYFAKGEAVTEGLATKAFTLPTQDFQEGSLQKVKQDTVKSAWDDTKKCIKDILVKQIMDWTVDQVTDWIQNGGDLGSRFTIDWEKDKDVAWNAGVGAVVNDTMFGFLCSPFRAQVKLSFMPVEKFHKRLECTLDKIAGNYNDFVDDFNKGGWLAYNAMWEPQNNYFGSVLLIHDEAAVRGEKKQSAAMNDLLAGGGFKSFKICKTKIEVGDVVDLSWYDNYELTAENFNFAMANAVSDNPNIVEDNNGNYCYKENLENATPGRVVGDMTQKYIVDNSDSALTYLGDSEDWGRWIEAIANAATNRLMKEGIAMMKPSSQGSQLTGLANEINNLSGANTINNQLVSSATTTAQKIVSATSTAILTRKGISSASASSSLDLAKNIHSNYQLIKPRQNTSMYKWTDSGAQASCLTPTINDSAYPDKSDIRDMKDKVDKLTQIVADIGKLQTEAQNLLDYLNNNSNSIDDKNAKINEFISVISQYSEVYNVLTGKDALSAAITENADLKTKSDAADTQLIECQKGTLKSGS